MLCHIFSSKLLPQSIFSFSIRANVRQRPLEERCGFYHYTTNDDRGDAATFLRQPRVGTQNQWCPYRDTHTHTRGSEHDWGTRLTRSDRGYRGRYVNRHRTILSKRANDTRMVVACPESDAYPLQL